MVWIQNCTRGTFTASAVMVGSGGLNISHSSLNSISIRLTWNQFNERAPVLIDEMFCEVRQLMVVVWTLEVLRLSPLVVIIQLRETSALVLNILLRVDTA